MEESLLERRYAVGEYLRLEHDSSQRHEYYNGEIIAMAGGSPTHSLIIANVLAGLHSRLQGKPCRVYDSNLRVRVPQSRMYVYPDATVICGPPQFDADDKWQTTVNNPKLVVEVLSPSTSNRDYGVKFVGYTLCETLEEYLVVTHDTAHVTTLFRQGDGTWNFTPVDGIAQTVRIRSLGFDLPLAEIYAGVEFPPELIMPVAAPGDGL